MVTVDEAAKPDPDTVTVVPTGPDVGATVTAELTVKVAEADLELPSVITTVWAPTAEAGTVNVAPANEPVAPVLVVPPRLTDTPLNFAVNAEDPEKPVPDTVTVIPTLPLVGLKVIAGLTVNVAVAALALASVAVTVLPPLTAAGTVKVQLKDPKASVVTVEGTVTIVVLTNFTVTVLEAAKPDPDTVTVEPTIPEDGLKLIDCVTVKVAEPELTPSLAPTV
jgi:hypothetical protein